MRTFANSIAQVDQWLSETGGSIGLATLSVGLDPHADRFALKALALGQPDGRAICVSGADLDLVSYTLKAALAGGRRVYAHQARDISWGLRATTGLKATGLLCTMVAAQTVQPGRAEGYSLSSLRPGAGSALDELRARAGGRHGTALKAWLPAALTNPRVPNAAVQRCAADLAVETAALAKESMQAGFVPQVQARLDVEQVWRWQGYDGIRLDRAATQSAANRIRVQAGIAARKLGFDPMNSTAAKAWAQNVGVQLPVAASGQVTLSRERLDEAVVPGAVAEQWKQFLKARNLGSFTGKLSELLEAVDAEGLVHPEVRIFTDRASTGRMAVSKPALQNLSNAELEGTGLNTLRNCLIAAPGKVLVSCDLAHVEPSVLAAISEDEALNKAVAADADVYVETAVVLWGEKARSDKSARASAKTILLALLYGKGDASLAADLGGTIAEARAAKASLLGGYPKMGAWVKDTMNRAKAGEQLLTACGRPVANRGPSEAYKMINYLIQGTAADVLCEMTVSIADELDESFPTARLWLPVHDELVIECDEADAEAVRSLLEAAMTTELNGVPIWGEAKILGKTWTK